jgi:fucose 4-O-acetylase-like acetyltransferase
MKTILPEQEKAATPFETPRDYLFDNLKFILIILVVFGHLIERYINQSIYLKVIFINIYLFHMPLFIFISGYFTKSIKSLSASKSIRQLIIPYIFFVILWNIVHKVNTGDYVSSTISSLVFIKPFLLENIFTGN